MAEVMKRAMATATRVVGNEEGNCNGGKSVDNGSKVGRQATASRSMATATGTCGQWQRQEGWRVTNRAKARAAMVMEMMMRVVGNEEGKGSKVIEGKGGKAMATATRVVSSG